MLSSSQYFITDGQEDASKLTEQFGKLTLSPLPRTQSMQTDSDGTSAFLSCTPYTPAMDAQKQTPLQRKTAEVLKSWEKHEKLAWQDPMFDRHKSRLRKLKMDEKFTIYKLEIKVNKLISKTELNDTKKSTLKELRSKLEMHHCWLMLGKSSLDHATTQQKKVIKKLETSTAQHAAQVTRLTQWLLEYQHDIRLTSTAVSQINNLITDAHRNQSSWEGHPSDALIYLAIFHQLIGTALEKAKGKEKSMKELYVYETVVISYALTLKVMGDNYFWLSDCTDYIDSSYYSPIFDALKNQESNELQKYLTKYWYKKPKNIHSRIRMLESKALCELDFNLTCHLSIKEQAEIVAKLELCEEYSRMLDPDSDTDNGLKQAYLNIAQDAVLSLSHIFPQRHTNNVKATFEFEMKL